MKKDCWNIVGVHGDRSCPELERHVHCRNCPVYSTAALALLDRELPDANLADHTSHFAKPKPKDEAGTESVVIFRIGSEWFALPTGIVKEVADVRPIHSIPHRRGGAVLGVANVRGELVVCVALDRLLDLPPADEQGSRAARRRLLVLRRDAIRAVCPADEVHGIHRVRASEVQEVPATVGKSSGRHSKAIISWAGRSVGLIDDQVMFNAVQRSMA